MTISRETIMDNTVRSKLREGTPMQPDTNIPELEKMLKICCGREEKGTLDMSTFFHGSFDEEPTCNTTACQLGAWWIEEGYEKVTPRHNMVFSAVEVAEVFRMPLSHVKLLWFTGGASPSQANTYLREYIEHAKQAKQLHETEESSELVNLRDDRDEAEETRDEIVTTL